MNTNRTVYTQNGAGVVVCARAAVAARALLALLARTVRAARSVLTIALGTLKNMFFFVLDLTDTK